MLKFSFLKDKNKYKLFVIIFPIMFVTHQYAHKLCDFLTILQKVTQCFAELKVANCEAIKMKRKTEIMEKLRLNTETEYCD